MIELIPLERIDDNPFQTRTVYNEAAIEELAADIKHLEPARPETLGLIQVPLGRLVYHEPDGTVTVLADPLTKLAAPGSVDRLLAESRNFRIQLAAGHSRLRAFHKLAEADTHWSTMPVDLANLTDSEMDDIAYSENAKRTNPNAIDEAESFNRSMDKFGYTLEELAERRDLSISAISNKRRLLHLPIKVKQLVKSGDLKERHARELLPLVQVLKDNDKAIRLAKETVKGGFSAKDVATQVDMHLARNTWTIPPDIQDFNRWNGHPLPKQCQSTCTACEFRSKDKCLKPGAAQTKQSLYHVATLEITAAAVGLPVYDGYFEHTPETYAVAKESNCDRLAITRSDWVSDHVVNASDEFDNIYYSCLDGYKCQCKQAQIEAREETETDNPWAPLQAWKTEQQTEGKKVFEMTLDHLEGAFEPVVKAMDEKTLAYFVALIKNIDSRLNVDYSPESVSHYLAVAANARQWGTPHTVGKALLHRAKLYQLCRINTPIDEIAARLVIIEELFTMQELTPPDAIGVTDWSFENEFKRCDEILKAHPGHQEQRQKLTDLKGRFATMKR